MKKLVVIIISFLALAACGQSSTSEDPLIASRSLPQEPLTQTVSTPEAETFTASISVLSQIKSNGEFTVEATLKNLTDHELTIQHAARVFYFSIKDNNGKGVNTFVMPNIGIVRTIQGKEEITEQYSYKIEKPGRYEISATSRFSTGKGDNMKGYELITNKAPLMVVE